MLENTQRFSMLVCLGGGEDAFLGLRYASKLESGQCCDIDLLYVRPLDKGLSSGGLEVRLARENLLNWGLELPGVRQLKRGRDLLVELGRLARESEASWTHAATSGDPVGDYRLEYVTDCGGTIGLVLRPADDVRAAVAEQCARRHYDLIIVGVSGKKDSALKRWISGEPLSSRLARRAPVSVLVAKHPESSGSHLVVTDGSIRSLAAVDSAAAMSARCGCPMTLAVLIEDPGKKALATDILTRSREIAKARNAPLARAMVLSGPPLEAVLEAARDHVVVFLADTDNRDDDRALPRNLAYLLLERTEASVVILR